MVKYALLFLLCCLGTIRSYAADNKVIRVSTDKTDLIFRVAPNGRLYQSYFGLRLLDDADADKLCSVSGSEWEAYPASGMEDYFEPALAVTHNDGNMTTLLKYVSSENRKIDDNVIETLVVLRDEVYPVEVRLHYMAFGRENIIKAWTEISHKEKKPVVISQYASSMLYLDCPHYFLTEFSGDWAQEVQMSTQELLFGKKLIDTKLGSRAAMHTSPFFQLGLNRPAAENQGQVLMGTIGWTGNFRFTFEVDNMGVLRVISGINPYASAYELKSGEVFETPEFIFTLSDEGTGRASRDFHDWARRYQLKDGMGERLTLLNNWESTGFDFDQNKLSALMQEAAHLGVDMFLLDDGWFGNKYPRANDGAGLGDWDVTKSKLPDGIAFLVKEAGKVGVKFGIWIEPEMANPKSELFEKHPEWAIHLPNRETYYYRNQLVLDMSNPKVQDYVFGIVDKLMTENSGIAYFKWDCNSPITNIYSPFLKEKQSQLYIDHVRGVYSVFQRINAKYPALPMMLCSGGGARCDYEALKYFTEFWPSDNTEPVERIFIQWGFCQFFPSRAISAHVTSWGKQSVKFRTDVAMMGKLGFDLRIADLSDNDQVFCRQAVGNFKRLSPVTMDGDLFRLVSPYETEHAALMYSSKDKHKAVLYAYNMYPRYNEKLFPVKLQGLDPMKRYKIEEINLMPGKKSSLTDNGKVYSGDYLMKVGLNVLGTSPTTSRILEITAE